MAASLTDEETFKLIYFKSEHAIQAMLEDCRSDNDIFLKIYQEMHQGLKKKTGQQCSGKIKKLDLIFGIFNTVEEKLVEVGGNGRFLKPWMLF